MNFTINQSVLGDLTRQLKDLTTHWKEHLHPYLHLTIQNQTLVCQYSLVDETLMGTMTFPLEQVLEEGTCLIAMEDWLQFGIRWKRTGSVHAQLIYPELVLTISEQVRMELPIHSFYFPTSPSLNTSCSLMSPTEWSLIASVLSKTVANQHPLKEYEGVWMTLEGKEMRFRSGTETELSEVKFPFHPENHPSFTFYFIKTQWLFLKQRFKCSIHPTEKLRLGLNDQFLLIETNHQQVFLKRETSVRSYVLASLDWLSPLDWKPVNPTLFIPYLQRWLETHQMMNGTKWSKGSVLRLNPSSSIERMVDETLGWELPARSVWQFVKEDESLERLSLGYPKSKTSSIIGIRFPFLGGDITRYYVSKETK